MKDEHFKVRYEKNFRGNPAVFVSNEETGYSMQIDRTINSDKDCVGHMVYFSYPAPKNIFDGEGIVATSRDAGGYRDLDKIPLDKEKQYFEVAAGLGGFVPYLIEQCSPVEKIKVIDPLDYSKVSSLIKFGLEAEFSSAINSRLEVLDRRCDIYLDPKVVDIFSCCLEDVPDLHPELKGMADVIVENAGPEYHYFQRSHQVGVEKMLQSVRDAKHFLRRN